MISPVSIKCGFRVYISVAVYYPEFLNRTLLLLLAQAEQDAPLSLITESFIVLLMYEIIKEAGVRLPKAIGGAVSIVSGIIIGDSAVSSGLISTPMLTIIAISVISGFVVPDLSYQITVFRFLFLIAGGVFGLFGISLLGAVMIFNICSTEDYDYPVTSPISPFKSGAMRDIVTRVGFRKMQHGNFTVEKLK